MPAVIVFQAVSSRTSGMRRRIRWAGAHRNRARGYEYASPSDLAPAVPGRVSSRMSDPCGTCFAPATRIVSTLERPPLYRSGGVATGVTVSVPATALRADPFPAHYRLAMLLASAQLALVLATAPWYHRYGLEIAWSTALPVFAGHATLIGLWLYFRRYAHHPTKHIVLDVIMATGLLVVLTDVVSPAQYLAVALQRPLVDGWLAQGDAAIGIHVPTLAAWTARHPAVSRLLTASYFSLLPQFFVPILLLGLRFRDRRRLWEYVFHFHFCLVATLAALALFPAECAFLYYGFESTIDQTRFITQFSGLRNGTFHVITFGNLEGLISMPSFHVTGGVMVTWAFRERWGVFLPLIGLNVALVAATFMSGAHYFVDVIASLFLFIASVCIYRRWIEPHSVAGTHECRDSSLMI